MRIRQCQLVFLSMIAVLGVTSQPLFACLRTNLDDRAVEWSSQIVVAKLLTIGNPVPLPSPATQPSNNSQPASDFQLFRFEVAAPLDGPAKAGDHISIIRFFRGTDSGGSSICHQLLGQAQIGKSFLLLLRPEKDLAWGGKFDPRTPQIHDTNAFMVVYLASMDDLGSDGLDDAKYTISSTRAAEAQFNADDAKTQAETMINAADDTEESQAEDALLEMGPKALKVLNDELAKADGVGKTRLQKIIDSVSPPSITAVMKSN
jgi:hypothetical protein